MNTAKGPRGRDRFVGIALEHLARAIAAEELGVGYRDVSVSTRDASGSRAAHVSAPVALRSPRIESPGAGEPLPRRLTAASAAIRGRLAALTGLEVARVDLRATGARILSRRVR